MDQAGDSNVKFSGFRVDVFSFKKGAIVSIKFRRGINFVAIGINPRQDAHLIPKLYDVNKGFESMVHGVTLPDLAASD